MADEKTPPRTHSPLPWRVEENWYDGPLFDLKSGDLDIGTSMVYDTAHPEVRDFDADAANAAFVVKAVNCHDELVAALKAWLAFLDALPGSTEFTFSSGRALIEARNKSDSALAKADASVEDVGER